MKAKIIMVCACSLIAACSNDELTVGTQASSNTAMSGEVLLSDFLLGQKSYVTRSGTTTHKSIDVHLWHPDSMNSVSGGTITINNQAIPRTTVQGNTWYQNVSSAYTVPLTLDGTYHVFNIAGGTGYPAFVDSLPAPTSATIITYPGPTDTLSKSAGATITWGPTGAAEVVRVVIQDTSRSIGSKAFVKDLPGSSGSTTLTSTDLSTLKRGPIRVSIFRGNSVSGTAGPGQKYRIVIYSSQEVSAWLKM